jgi:hypothetical protein
MKLNPMHSAIRKTLLASAIFGTVALFTNAPSFAWTCGSNGICVDLKPRGNILLVRITAQKPVTHINVIPISPKGGQFEVQAEVFSLPIGFESRVRYKVQKCVRGGIAQRSNCGPWATFSRKVD